MVIFIGVIAAGMYKFNYLSGQPGYDVDGNRMDINNFDDCVAAGYPVMESYPEQCSDGEQTFVNGGGIISEGGAEGPIPVEPDGGIGDGAGPLDQFIRAEAEHIAAAQSLALEGMSEEDAARLAQTVGVSFRVVERDGQPLAVTMDYRPGRINAVITNGAVVSYTIEGAEAQQ